MLTVSQGLIFAFFSAATSWMITENGHDATFNLTFRELSIKEEKYTYIAHERERNYTLFRMLKNLTITYFKPYGNRVNITAFAPTKGITFNLQNVTSKDAGKYVCHLKAKENPICTELLIVTDTPEKPVLTVDVTAVAGKKLTLSCSSQSTTHPSDHNLTMNYVWRRNPPNDKLPLKDGSHLTIPMISKEDDGVKYSCQAKEQHGLGSVWSDYVTMDVQYGPDRAILSPDTTTYNVTENNLLTVECYGDCKPACNVTWWDNTEQNVAPWRGNKTVLQIWPTKTMAGHYKCKVSNIHGESLKYFDINVMYVPLISTFTVNNRKNVTVKEGEAVNFICTGDSNPSHVVTFISDMNSPIVVNSTAHGFNSSYTISSVNCSHHGQHHCEVSNSIGSTNDSVDITVKCGPRQRGIIRQQTNSSTASWRFLVWAYPMPEDKLFFSNQTGAVRSITTSQKYQLKHFSIRENLHDYTFLIQNVDSNDFGNYTIMIQNAEGSKNISISLVEEGSVGPIKQADTPVAIIVSAICSLMFVVAAICAAVYINRYKNRKGQVYSIPEEDGNDVGDERSLYARVNKPKIKPCKAKKREGGDVYTTVKKSHTQPKPCTNHLYMASGRPSEGQALIHRDADDRMSGNVNNNCGEKNAEGLTYADLDLAPPTMVNGQPVINSKEEPVVYEEIDFSQTPGPQLPEKIWEKEGSAP